MDGTLAPSKGQITPVMADLLSRLMQVRKVAIISGGAWPQFQKQVLPNLELITKDFSNLYILPTSGTTLYVWNEYWQQVYNEELTLEERTKIITSFKESLFEYGFNMNNEHYGEILEDRISQVTFSGLGSTAPIEKKKIWDPNQEIRKGIVEILSKKIPEFDIKIGGMTSIDITKSGINKAYGIKKLMDQFGYELSDILFVGDAIFPGGNDYSPKELGVHTHAVVNELDTENLLTSWLN